MKFKDTRLRTPAAVVRQVLTTPAINQSLNVFKQRRPFSDALNEDSYKVDENSTGGREVLVHPVWPLDPDRNSRTPSTTSATGQATTVETGGGESGGGSTLTGSGISQRAAMWTSATNLSTMDIINNAGNIGIGTSTAAQKLQVSGTIQMTGFKLTTSPVNGYILTSDAAGVGTWQPNGGGGGSTGIDVIGHALLMGG